VLYALLAGCGPLRAGEALGLEISEHISEDCRTLYIRQKAKRGQIQEYTKTTSGTELRCQGETIGRDVDLSTSLAAMVRDHIGGRRSGLLCCTSSGRQLLQTNVLRGSLHPILKKLNHEQGGFNIFRRFRITELQTAECPKPLQHFWSGHAQTHVSERYIKLLRDRDLSVGMGREDGNRVRASGLFRWRKVGQNPFHWPTHSVPKNRLSRLESGGREGIRTPGLLVANEEKSKLRLGATIT